MHIELFDAVTCETPSIVGTTLKVGWYVVTTDELAPLLWQVEVG